MLQASSMSHLRSLDSLTKTSQVSRAKGTTLTLQSRMMKEGSSRDALRVELVFGCSTTPMEMEVAGGFFHVSFEVIGQLDKDFTSL